MSDTVGQGTAESVSAVRIEGLTKRFGDIVAVDGLDLEVRRGEFFGLLGPNGAGKSTVIKIISGLLRPTAGSVMVGGHDVELEPLPVKAQIGLVPEDLCLYERLTGEEYVLFAGRMYGLAEEDVVFRTRELLDLLEMTQDGGRLIVDYSQGMRKKVALAAALIHSPRVLLLDEPFNGVDVVSSRVIRAILARLVERGVTVFFSSHVLETVERLCDRVAVLRKGKLAALGTLDELRVSFGASELATLEDIFLRTIGEDGRERSLSWMS
jgi:ABC-2 type transport system ATP-binding protein